MLVPAKSTLGSSGSTTATALATTTTSVNVSNAAVPSIGKTLHAESGTAASWQYTRLLNVKLSGAVGDDTSFDTTALATNDTTALAAGLANYFPKGTYKVSGTVVFSAHCIFDVGAIIHVTAGTITFNGGVTAEITQILDLESGVTASFSKFKTLVGYVEWFGAAPDDSGTDSLAAINSAIVALRKVQLMCAIYYTSAAITMDTLCGSLVGTSLMPGFTQMVTGKVSTICCTSGSTNILNVSSNADGVKISKIFITRNIAPVISSNCVGVNLASTTAVELTDIFSAESMTAFKFETTSWCRVLRCRAKRSYAGSGGGTDYHKGFYVYGATASNMSLYLDECYVGAEYTDTFTSYGYYLDDHFRDCFIFKPESYHTTYGLYIAGAAGKNERDLNITCPVLESSKEAIYISGANSDGSIIITGGHIYSSANTAPALTITGSKAQIDISGIEIFGDTKTSYPVIYCLNSKNIKIHGGSIIEPANAPVLLSGCANYEITIGCTNNTIASSPVSIATSTRGYLAMMMAGDGTYKRAKGYDVDATSSYNEFNCTGIDPACITGGSANKLVINSTQVTAVGIAAAGAGNNVASGVMA